MTAFLFYSTLRKLPPNDHQRNKQSAQDQNQHDRLFICKPECRCPMVHDHRQQGIGYQSSHGPDSASLDNVWPVPVVKPDTGNIDMKNAVMKGADIVFVIIAWQPVKGEQHEVGTEQGAQNQNALQRFRELRNGITTQVQPKSFQTGGQNADGVDPDISEGEPPGRLAVLRTRNRCFYQILHLLAVHWRGG